MATVSTGVKRAYLRFASRSAKKSGLTLLATLQAFSDSRVKQTGGGKVLIATRANLHEDQFSIPQDFNTTDAIEMAENMETRYEEALAFLIADGNPTPTDDQLFAEIIGKLNRVASVANDFTRIRLIRPFDDADDEEEEM